MALEQWRRAAVVSAIGRWRTRATQVKSSSIVVLSLGLVSQSRRLALLSINERHIWARHRRSGPHSATGTGRGFRLQGVAFNKPISKCKASSVDRTVDALGAVRIKTLYSSK